jgi:DNA-binding beta-propeller fold protein YncE
MKGSRVLCVLGVVLGALCADSPAGQPSDGSTVYQLTRVFPATGTTSVDLSPDGARIAVKHLWGDWNEGYREYDLGSGQILNECRVYYAPWSGRYSADGSHLWVTRYYGGYVSEIDLNTCQYGCDLSVGSWTQDLLFDETRRYLFVAENDPGTGAIGSVKVVDTQACSVVCTVPLNGEPAELAKAPGSDFVYVTSRNPGTERLYKINATSCAVAGTLDLPGVGDPGVSVAPNGSRVYVPNKASGVVHVVDAGTMLELESWSIPGDPTVSDWGFHIEPAGEYAIHERTAINTRFLANEHVVQEIPLQGNVLNGHNRWRPVWSPDGSTAYVPVEGTGGDAGVVELVRRYVFDFDNDGVLDSDDKCPATDPSVTVVINDCDTGVDNHLFEYGCSMLDLIEECQEGARITADTKVERAEVERPRRG